MNGELQLIYKYFGTGLAFEEEPILVAHFGLGGATDADMVRTAWPSGTVQELQNVAAKQMSEMNL